MPITGVGIDGAVATFVVEAHVAAGHRRAQRLARIAHAADRLGELPHHLGAFGVAEVQAVRDRERSGPRDRHVARGLRHRVHRAEVGIQAAVAALAVARDDDGLQRARHADHRAVGIRARHRVALHDPVVLPPDPALRGDRRRCEHRAQRLAQIAVERRQRGVGAVGPLGLGDRAVVLRPVVGQRAGGHLGDHLSAVADREGRRPRRAWRSPRCATPNARTTPRRPPASRGARSRASAPGTPW